MTQPYVCRYKRQRWREQLFSVISVLRLYVSNGMAFAAPDEPRSFTVSNSGAHAVPHGLVVRCSATRGDADFHVVTIRLRARAVPSWARTTVSVSLLRADLDDSWFCSAPLVRFGRSLRRCTGAG